MQHRILLRHLKASRASQVEEFPVEGLRELMIGRDPGAHVRYDPEREDLVSRLHAKIIVDSTDPVSCSVMDLNSRNGTFVNRQRIYSGVKLIPGDVVQLGPGGPEFQFDLDPRPPGVRPSRVASGPMAAVAPARDVQVSAPPAAPPPAGSPVRKAAAIALIAVLAVAVTALAVWNARKQRQPAAGKPMTPAEIAQANTGSVVFFEAGWKLIDRESGRQLYHVYQPNAMKDQDGRVVPVLQGAGGFLPVFVLLPGEQEIEPMLATDEGQGKYKAIGGAHTGSGFVVSSDGFILTSRHVAATWQTRYNWPRDDRAGVVYVLDGHLEVKTRRVISANQFPAWIPAAAKFVLQGSFDQDAARLAARTLQGGSVEGRNDYLDVAFPGNHIRIPARLEQLSGRGDLALVRVNVPRELRKLELYDKNDSIKPGDAAIVLGFPVATSEAPPLARTRDGLNPDMAAKVVPDPTASAGSIDRVIRGEGGRSEVAAGASGDLYQLAIGSTPGGYSGGPVFDDQGRVIAVFAPGRSSPGEATISFAVPIRYGIELMGTSKVLP